VEETFQNKAKNCENVKETFFYMQKCKKEVIRPKVTEKSISRSRSFYILKHLKTININ